MTDLSILALVPVFLLLVVFYLSYKRLSRLWKERQKTKKRKESKKKEEKFTQTRLD